MFSSNIVNASYNYSPKIEAIESALSMNVTKVIDNVNLEDVNGNKPNVKLNSLKDVKIYEDKNLYI